jgi:phosphatidate cytidylyltransferase
VKRRVGTAAVAIPLVLGAMTCAKHLPIICLGIVSFAVGWLEFRALVKGSVLAGVAGAVVGIIPLIAVATFLSVHAVTPTLGWASLGLAALGVAAAFASLKGRGGVLGIALASLWVAGPLCAVLVAHFMDGPSTALWNLRCSLLLFLFPLWAGDSAAIFVGKAWGRRALAPGISPNKTVEGATANLLACILLGWGAGVWVGVGPAAGIACGLACGVFGQLGDLFESRLKRIAGVKDSGSLLPGHGGLLDRIDSLLFSAPVVLLLLIYVR